MTAAISGFPVANCFSIDADLAEGEGRKFGKIVLDALDRGMTDVIIDCRNWHRLDLTLLSALVRCADVFARHGARLEFTNLSPEMRATVRELRLQTRMRIPD